jgi:competence protein ComEA
MQGAQTWWRRPRLLAALACVLIGVVVLFGGPALRGAQASATPPPTEEPGLTGLDEEPTTVAPTEAAPLISTDLIVYVSGAVAVPDVYRLPEGARVLDAVLAAGGLGDDAASEEVNLAAPLSDAQHIHIPHQGEAASAPTSAATGGSSTTSGVIDLNQASAVDLEELPGIGKALAARIVAYREQQGPFTAVDDLQKVSGIGDALFAKISPLVTVGP